MMMMMVMMTYHTVLSSSGLVITLTILFVRFYVRLVWGFCTIIFSIKRAHACISHKRGVFYILNCNVSLLQKTV